MISGLTPVVLCGGSGTRLWPLSRSSYPKQFLRLLGKETLLQQTMLRIKGMDSLEPAILVCNESSRFIAAEQLREIGIEDASILLEPLQRNTAPAVASAAVHAMAQGDDPLLLVLPADHMIKDQDALYKAIGTAMRSARKGNLVTFGITPTGPETGYGYIKAEGCKTSEAWPILKFVEKPDRSNAEKFLASGDYSWNSGMFLFRASRYLEELDKFHPEIVTACRNAIEAAKKDMNFIRLDGTAYAKNSDKAIDTAVMERTACAQMVPLSAGWSDIGSWDAVHKAADLDESGNSVCGDVLLQECENCMVHGTSRLVTAMGLRNAVIVETADAILVMDKSVAQNTKAIVEKLQCANRRESDAHRQIYRPWGSFDAIENGSRFQVKRISVKPGAKLSMQMHHHRAEHWIVVSGTARITNGKKQYLLSENQSTYIPIGEVHSLENPGKIPLELIEVQSGAYLGEDDIVRLEDIYGRD